MPNTPPLPPLPASLASLRRVRICAYASAAHLVADVVPALLRGEKLVLELQDDPDLVSRLLAAVGTASGVLRHQHSLVVALDPVPTDASASYNNHHHQHAHHHHHHADPYLMVVRTVPLPPAHAAGGGHADCPAYIVGAAIGQEVIRAKPMADAQPLCGRILRGVLRDGLVTVRCRWQDEELTGAAPAPPPAHQQQHGRPPPAQQLLQLFQQLSPLAAGSGAPSVQPPAAQLPSIHSSHQQQQQGEASDSSTDECDIAAGSDGQASLVCVPAVLRAAFKADRQLRSHGLGGLVLLPHTFTRCPSNNSLVVYLDVVLA